MKSSHVRIFNIVVVLVVLFSLFSCTSEPENIEEILQYGSVNVVVKEDTALTSIAESYDVHLIFGSEELRRSVKASDKTIEIAFDKVKPGFWGAEVTALDKDGNVVGRVNEGISVKTSECSIVSLNVAPVKGEVIIDWVNVAECVVDGSEKLEYSVQDAAGNNITGVISASLPDPAMLSVALGNCSIYVKTFNSDGIVMYENRFDATVKYDTPVRLDVVSDTDTKVGYLEVGIKGAYELPSDSPVDHWSITIRDFEGRPWVENHMLKRAGYAPARFPLESAGSYEVSVTAFDADGSILGSGFSSTYVDTGKLSRIAVPIDLITSEKDGMLQVYFESPEEVACSAYVTVGNVDREINVLRMNEHFNLGSIVLPEGEYTLHVDQGGNKNEGKVSIQNGMTTYRTVHMGYIRPDMEKIEDITVRIPSVADVREGGSVFLDVTPFVRDPFSYDVKYSWYVDDELVSEDEKLHFDASSITAGPHRLSFVYHTRTDGSVIASSSFNVIRPKVDISVELPMSAVAYGSTISIPNNVVTEDPDAVIAWYANGKRVDYSGKGPVSIKIDSTLGLFEKERAGKVELEIKNVGGNRFESIWKGSFDVSMPSIKKISDGPVKPGDTVVLDVDVPFGSRDFTVDWHWSSSIGTLIVGDKRQAYILTIPSDMDVYKHTIAAVIKPDNGSPEMTVETVVDISDGRPVNILLPSSTIAFRGKPFTIKLRNSYGSNWIYDLQMDGVSFSNTAMYKTDKLDIPSGTHTFKMVMLSPENKKVETEEIVIEVRKGAPAVQLDVTHDYYSDYFNLTADAVFDEEDVDRSLYSLKLLTGPSEQELVAQDVDYGISTSVKYDRSVPVFYAKAQLVRNSDSHVVAESKPYEFKLYRSVLDNHGYENYGYDVIGEEVGQKETDLAVSIYRDVANSIHPEDWNYRWYLSESPEKAFYGADAIIKVPVDRPAEKKLEVVMTHKTLKGVVLTGECILRIKPCTDMTEFLDILSLTENGTIYEGQYFRKNIEKYGSDDSLQWYVKDSSGKAIPLEASTIRVEDNDDHYYPGMPGEGEPDSMLTPDEMNYDAKVLGIPSTVKPGPVTIIAVKTNTFGVSKIGVRHMILSSGQGIPYLSDMHDYYRTDRLYLEVGPYFSDAQYKWYLDGNLLRGPYDDPYYPEPGYGSNSPIRRVSQTFDTLGMHRVKVEMTRNGETFTSSEKTFNVIMNKPRLSIELMPGYEDRNPNVMASGYMDPSDERQPVHYDIYVADSTKNGEFDWRIWKSYDESFGFYEEYTEPLSTPLLSFKVEMKSADGTVLMSDTASHKWDPFTVSGPQYKYPYLRSDKTVTSTFTINWKGFEINEDDWVFTWYEDSKPEKKVTGRQATLTMNVRNGGYYYVTCEAVNAAADMRYEKSYSVKAYNLDAGSNLEFKDIKSGDTINPGDYIAQSQTDGGYWVLVHENGNVYSLDRGYVPVNIPGGNAVLSATDTWSDRVRFHGECPVVINDEAKEILLHVPSVIDRNRCDSSVVKVRNSKADSYKWYIDGTLLLGSDGNVYTAAQLEKDSLIPGRHNIYVTAEVDGRTIDSYTYKTEVVMAGRKIKYEDAVLSPDGNSVDFKVVWSYDIFDKDFDPAEMKYTLRGGIEERDLKLLIESESPEFNYVFEGEKPAGLYWKISASSLDGKDKYEYESDHMPDGGACVSYLNIGKHYIVAPDIIECQEEHSRSDVTCRFVHEGVHPSYDGKLHWVSGDRWGSGSDYGSNEVCVLNGFYNDSIRCEAYFGGMYYMEVSKSFTYVYLHPSPTATIGFDENLGTIVTGTKITPKVSGSAEFSEMYIALFQKDMNWMLDSNWTPGKEVYIPMDVEAGNAELVVYGHIREGGTIKGTMTVNVEGGNR